MAADYKAQFSFFDLSTENDHDSMVDLHVFRPPEKMPTEVKAGDLIVVLQAKVIFSTGLPQQGK